MAKSTVHAYVRVSTQAQDETLQVRAIKRWADAHGHEVKWHRDRFTGKTMSRPGWSTLETEIRRGRAQVVVVWKLDRLGRTASGLHQLFDELVERHVKLISLTEGFDLSSAFGRLVAGVLASVAAFETEVRAERVKAGQEAARQRGKRWGGSKPGWTKLSPEQIEAIRMMRSAGKTQAAIAETLGITRQTVARLLKPQV